MRVIIASLLMLVYPLLVYIGLARFEPRVVAALLARWLRSYFDCFDKLSMSGDDIRWFSVCFAR